MQVGHCLPLNSILEWPDFVTELHLGLSKQVFLAVRNSPKQELAGISLQHTEMFMYFFFQVNFDLRPLGSTLAPRSPVQQPTAAFLVIVDLLPWLQ